MPNAIEQLEKRIITRVFNGLLSHGYELSICNGENETGRLYTTANCLREAMAASQDVVYVWHRPDVAGAEFERIGWVSLVYGNGCDVISDYTTNLEGALKNANEFAEQSQ